MENLEGRKNLTHAESDWRLSRTAVCHDSRYYEDTRISDVLEAGRLEVQMAGRTSRHGRF